MPSRILPLCSQSLVGNKTRTSEADYIGGKMLNTPILYTAKTLKRRPKAFKNIKKKIETEKWKLCISKDILGNSSKAHVLMGNANLEGTGEWWVTGENEWPWRMRIKWNFSVASVALQPRGNCFFVSDYVRKGTVWIKQMLISLFKPN